MVFAVDIGNTNIVIGCCRDNKIIFVERVSTKPDATVLEYAISFKSILEFYGILSQYNFTVDENTSYVSVQSQSKSNHNLPALKFQGIQQIPNLIPVSA